MLWRYGFQPQRTALRIYWNALKLLRPFGDFSDENDPVIVHR